MIIKIGLCLRDIIVPPKITKDLSQYDKLKNTILYKMRYIDRHIDRLFCIGARHIRLPSLLPMHYNQDHFNHLMCDKEFIGKCINLKNTPIEYSYHAPYWAKTKTKEQRKQFRFYLQDTKSIMDVLGIKEYTVVCHLDEYYRAKTVNGMALLMNSLPSRVKRHMAIENDDKINNLDTCLKFANTQNCPIVFDNLHNRLNSKYTLTYNDVAKKIEPTWRRSSNNVKIHYSNGDDTGKHSNYIDTVDLDKIIEGFSEYTNKLTIVFEIGSSQEEISYIHMRYPKGVYNKNDIHKLL